MGERQLIDLNFDCLSNFWMAVTKARNSGPARSIQIAIALGINDINAIAMRSDRRDNARVAVKYVAH